MSKAFAQAMSQLRLTAREIAGCALIFAAVVAAQLPLGRLLCRRAKEGHGS